MILTRSDAPAATEEELDGRRQRSETSRRRIVQAMLALIGAGDVAPNAESIAARAGLGLRTVFRHFENMESLYREINAAVTAELQPLVKEPFRNADWRAQLSELLDRRVRIFERIMPFKVAGDIHRHRSPFIARKSVELARDQRAVLVRIVPREARADSGFLEALDLLLSLDTWLRLRREQKLSVARARRTVEIMLAALLNARRARS